MAEETQENTQKPLNIAFDVAQDITFCEAVTVEANPENVKLSFVQLLPNVSSPANPPELVSPLGIGPGIGQLQFPNAKVVARIALTWPHFIRLASVLTDTVKNNQGTVKETLDKLIETFNNG